MLMEDVCWVIVQTAIVEKLPDPDVNVVKSIPFIELNPVMAPVVKGILIVETARFCVKRLVKLLVIGVAGGGFAVV